MNKYIKSFSLIFTLLAFTLVEAKTPDLDNSTKALLKLTGATSVEELMTSRTQEMHQALQYFSAYEQCARILSKQEYLHDNAEKFSLDVSNAKYLWNDFIDNKLLKLVGEKSSMLTKDNLKKRLKDCSKKQKVMSAKLKTLEAKLAKENPGVRSLGIDFYRDKNNLLKKSNYTHTQLNTVSLPIANPLIFVKPRPMKDASKPTTPVRDMMRHSVDTSVVYLKQGEESKELQSINEVLRDIKSNTGLCKTHDGKAMGCFCSERYNFEKLGSLTQAISSVYPKWKKTTIVIKDKQGKRSGRIPLGAVSLKLKHFKKYCIQ